MAVSAGKGNREGKKQFQLKDEGGTLQGALSRQRQVQVQGGYQKGLRDTVRPM